MFVPGLAAAGDELVIAGEEAHYLRRVVRIRAGERVTASDGEGTLAELTVLDAGSELRAEVGVRRSITRACRLDVWCGAPEGDRADWLVEKLAELGVASLRLVDCERTQWERAAKKSERWERLAVAALRQSRSAYRMFIEAPVPIAALLETPPDFAVSYLADPGGGSFVAHRQAGPRSIGAAVGPSGGFSDEERKSLEASSFVPTRLTESRLRTETAALAIAALVLAAGE